jgi:hypothetical protein
VYVFSKKMTGFSFLEGGPNKKDAEREPAGGLPSTRRGRIGNTRKRWTADEDKHQV